jgi:multiple sugar transport system permease protein
VTVGLQAGGRTLDSRGGRRGPDSPKRRRKLDLLPWGLVLPLAIFIVGLALIPAAYTIIASFFRVDELDPPVRFNGLANFVHIFSNDAIVSSMGNTLLYVLIGVALSTVLGIFFAVVLQQRFRGRSAVIAILILPWALPGVVEGIIWVNIWDANTGLLNSVLKSLNLIENYQVFLGTNHFLTVLLIEIVQVWQITPLSTLLILASLQNIPGELYEAGAIDGASPWKAFRSITLPLIRPGVTVAMVQAVIATLNVFDQPYVLNGAAATGSSVTMQTYFVTFQNLDFGEGYALSLIITIATLIISFGVLRLVYRPVEY